MANSADTPVSFDIGSVHVTVVSDGRAWSDGGGPFGLVPRVLWEKVCPPDEHNRVPVQLRCLLIEADGTRILVDTGYGDKLSDRQKRNVGLDPNEDGRLLRDLARAGVQPQDIDIVLDTHLHGDHSGGNTHYAGGEIVPTFPNATYWIQRGELATASYPDERTQGAYFAENFKPLEADGRVYVMSGDENLAPGVETWILPGHTPDIMAVTIESEGQVAIFPGDVCAWAVYLERLAWVPSYDVEPLVSIQSKKRMGRWCLEHDALIICQHDPTTLLGRLRARNGRWQVERLEQ